MFKYLFVLSLSYCFFYLNLTIGTTQQQQKGTRNEVLQALYSKTHQPFVNKKTKEREIVATANASR
jgi:hypothetical protein